VIVWLTTMNISILLSAVEVDAREDSRRRHRTD
jgi:hypothetical protein